MAVKPGAFVRTAVQKTQLQASSLCVAAGGCSLRHSLQWTPGLGWGGVPAGLGRGGVLPGLESGGVPPASAVTWLESTVAGWAAAGLPADMVVAVVVERGGGGWLVSSARCLLWGLTSAPLLGGKGGEGLHVPERRESCIYFLFGTHTIHVISVL